MFLADGRPLPFEGPASVTTIYHDLVARHGWHPEREIEGGEVIALRRGAASITLEPGAQLELSGAPQETIHQICAELRAHMTELADVSDQLGIRWLGLGFHPFARQEDLPWVPKLRYRVMRTYLPTRGSRALDMMRRTCTVQANVDFDSEHDAIRKLRVALRLQPITTAMFANSPWVEGRATGERSHRAWVWLDVDPDRSGLLPFAWHDDMSFQRYVEWALDVPMFLIKRGDQVIDASGMSFRHYLRDGCRGLRATMGDWETHLNTLFPEARLKKTIELRGADGQSTDLTCAMPALWKGLLYDARALDRVEALAERITFDELEAVRPDIARQALRARLGGRDLADWAGDLLDIASAGLGRLSNLNKSGEDERIHLRRLRELASLAKSPADILLEQIPNENDFQRRVLEQARV